MSNLIIKPIGIVRSEINEEMLKYSNKDIKLDHGLISHHRSNLKTQEILINKEYEECLDGIKDFSHIVVFFWTHKNSDEARQIKKVHPAGMEKMPIKGIFATRSPVRPNPICTTTVKLIKRIRNILIVEGLDAINNSPVIDIKPHLPSYDSPEDVKIADWMFRIMDEFKKFTKNSDANQTSEDSTFNMRKHPCLSPEQRES